MPGYTIEGLNNLIKKILSKMNNIVSQLKNMDQSDEEYYILLENYDRLMIDYDSTIDRKNELKRIINKHNA